jgi:hypothetical protein
MKLVNFLVVVLFSINVAATDCKESVTLLNEGQKAECTGFLFSPDAEKKASQAYDDAKYYKDLSDLLHKRNQLTNEEIKILDERLKLYQDQSHLLAQEVQKKEKEDFWQKTLYFGLGIMATSIAIYGAAQLGK